MAPATQSKKEKVPAKTGGKATQSTRGPESLVYVGPNLAGDLRLSQFTVYRGLPPEIKAALKEDKTLGRLFVPVAKLSTARAELAKPASGMSQAAGKTFKKYRLGGSK